MKILIDARLYGPKHTGNGRYTMNLLDNLAKIDLKNTYYILLRKENFENLNLPKNFIKILADFKHYTFEEQFKLSFMLWNLKPDLIHFPHFNVPLFYFGKYIVTIHDLIMHKFTAEEATTRPFPIREIWRLGYYLSFSKAVFGSLKIIVPSNAVKNELIDYYGIKSGKVEVIYE